MLFSMFQRSVSALGSFFYAPNRPFISLSNLLTELKGGISPCGMPYTARRAPKTHSLRYANNGFPLKYSPTPLPFGIAASKSGRAPGRKKRSPSFQTMFFWKPIAARRCSNSGTTRPNQEPSQTMKPSY